MSRSREALALGAALALAACQTSSDPEARASTVETLGFDLEAATASAPVAGDDVDSVWSYLVDRYDANDDGTITRDEYDRGEDHFGSLDGNDDGVITEDDLESGGSGMGSGRRGGGMMSSMMFTRFFQIDDDPEVLTADELEECVDVADKDLDDLLTEEEFEYLVSLQIEDAADSDAGMSSMMRRMNPFEMLVGDIDEDEDGAMSRDELIAHFEGLDDDDDGELQRPSMGGGSGSSSRFAGMLGGGGRSRGGGDRDSSGGPREGSPAPDFTLQDLNGGGTVTLSDFAGNRPVALIFGSYT